MELYTSLFILIMQRRTEYCKEAYLIIHLLSSFLSHSIRIYDIFQSKVSIMYKFKINISFWNIF